MAARNKLCTIFMYGITVQTFTKLPKKSFCSFRQKMTKSINSKQNEKKSRNWNCIITHGIISALLCKSNTSPISCSISQYHNIPESSQKSSQNAKNWILLEKYSNMSPSRLGQKFGKKFQQKLKELEETRSLQEVIQLAVILFMA